MPQPEYIPREDFLNDYVDIGPGQHVNVISPTGGGKSVLLYQMLGKTLERYPDLRAASLMPKPRDPTTDEWKASLGLKETDHWPPAEPWPWQQKPNGHILWPKHIQDDEDRNREHLSKTFMNCLNQQYWKGNSITLVDDAYVIGVMLGLNQYLDRHWIAGRSSRAGLWTSLQKPSGTTGGAISSFAYDSPTHLFLGRDNDARNLKRFSEISISQIDPREIENIVKNLRVHRIGDSAVSEMLYLDRRGPYMAIVGV